MMKKFLAGVTAAAVGMSMLMTASAEAELVYITYGISNAVHINVTDSSGEPLQASMELTDSDGTLCATFASNAKSFSSWNDSEINYDPIDNPRSFYVGMNALSQYVPNGMELLSYNGLTDNGTGGKPLEEGETWDVTLAYKDPAEEPALTVPANMMGIYTDSAISIKAADPYYKVNNAIYYAKDSIGQTGNIAYYDYTGATTTSLHGIENCSEGSAASPKAYTETSEYVIRELHVTELSQRFTEDGYFCFSRESGDVIFDLNCDTDVTISSFAIVSGAMINFVVPDDEGYVRFYAALDTLEYEMDFDYSYKNAANFYLGSSVSESGTAADKLDITAAIPDFPECGTNLIKVPAGEYTLSFSRVPDGYIMPEDVNVTINDSSELQTVSVILEKESMKGDIDIDGDVDLDDTLLALTHYAAIGSDLESPLNAAQQVIADVNMDGSIDLVDASAIIRYYAGICAGLDPQW